MENGNFRILPVLLLTAAALLTGCSKQAKIDRHTQRADQYYASKDFDKAEIEYLNVVRLDRKNTNALVRLGAMAYEEGRVPQAYMYLTPAKELAPQHVETRQKLGNTLLTVGKFAEARDEALFVLSKQPTNEEALLLLVGSAMGSRNTNDMQKARQQLAALQSQAGNQAGYYVALAQLALTTNDIAGAESFIKKGLALNPKSSVAHSAAGQLALRTNGMAQAEQHLKSAADFAESASARQLNYVDFKIQSGDIPAAKAALESTVAKNPRYLPIIQRQAQIALHEKRFDDCDAILTKILARDAMNYDARLLKGRMHLAKLEAPKAIAEFERLTKTHPRVPQVFYFLALAQLQHKDMERTIFNLNQAVAIQPTYNEAAMLLAQINIRRGDANAAITTLGPLIRENPRNAQPQFLLAQAQLARRNYEEAADIYRRLAAAFPSNAQPALLLGAVYLQQNKTNEARQNFEKALRLAPTSYDALRNVVLLDIAGGRFSEAEQRIKDLQTRYTNSAPLYLLLGDVYANQFLRATNNTAFFDQAEGALLKAIELQTNFYQAHMALARFYVVAKHQDQALKKLQSMLVTNPKDLDSLFLIASIHDQRKDYNAARDAYEKMLAVEPKSTIALNNLAYLCSEHLNQLDRAYEAATQARKLNSKDPYLADTLGWILYKRGDYTGALKLLQESADTLEEQDRPGAQLQTAEVLYHLGMAYYMTGQPGPAKQALTRSLQLADEKEFTGKAQAAERLAQLSSGSTGGTQNLADLEKRFQAQPKDPILMAQLATAYEAAGNSAKARALYEQLLQANPGNVATIKSLARLTAASPTERPKAIELAKRARTMAPNDPEVAHLLGRLAYDSGDHKWALALLQESARKLPQNPEVQLDFAWALFSNGRLPEAETALQTAASTQTPWAKSAEAKEFLSLIRASNPTNASKAAPEAQKALQANPTYAPALLVKALASEQQRDSQTAQQAYQTILASHSSFAVANKHMARLLIEEGAPQKAYDHAAKAREAFPNDPEVARNLGIAAYSRNEHSRAAQLLTESARQRPTDALQFFYLGMAQVQLKQLKPAADNLSKAISQGLKEPQLGEARRALSSIKT